jgi:hypothetical protein
LIDFSELIVNLSDLLSIVKGFLSLEVWGRQEVLSDLKDFEAEELESLAELSFSFLLFSMDKVLLAIDSEDKRGREDAEGEC